MKHIKIFEEFTSMNESSENVGSFARQISNEYEQELDAEAFGYAMDWVAKKNLFTGTLDAGDIKNLLVKRHGFEIERGSEQSRHGWKYEKGRRL